MQALLIKIVKIIVTIFCSFIILGGILMIADEPVNKTNDNITFRCSAYIFNVV